MTTRPTTSMLKRRALRVEQTPGSPLFVFCLTATEIQQIADISRVSRDGAGDVIGYQRPEVRQHVQEIADYVDSPEVIFPNPIILALPSSVRFTNSRGRNVSDGVAAGGMLSIPLAAAGGPKPGWIVDGQQRTLALAKARRQDLPVLVTAFVADSVETQRDQFLRINNTKPLPRGLVTELLPSITTPLPPRLTIRKAPSALCDLLNTDAESPFLGIIRRPSTPAEEKSRAVITDTSVVNMLTESLSNFGGCLYPYRNPTSGETDYAAVLRTVTVFWTCVRDTFPDAWGRPPEESRLMHGAGLRAMGRLMDRVMGPLNPNDEATPKKVMSDLHLIAPYCRWTEGTWDDLGWHWDAVQNNSRHIAELSSYLIRLYTQSKAAQP